MKVRIPTFGTGRYSEFFPVARVERRLDGGWWSV